MSSGLTPLQAVPPGRVRYSHILRCIGISLEATELKALELRKHGEEFIAQGWHRGPFSSMDFEKHYTLEDIEKLDAEGRQKRKKFSGVANLLSLSQILRLAGNYVDRMGGRLLRVSWQDQSDKIQSITVQYEALHAPEHSEHQVQTIEEICLHVYRQKKKIAAPSDKHIHRHPTAAANSSSS
jgi:hypothetical protein